MPKNLSALHDSIVKDFFSAADQLREEGYKDGIEKGIEKGIENGKLDGLFIGIGGMMKIKLRKRRLCLDEVCTSCS
ncbi:MAG: hypothetical protein NUW37_03485 [Planctomycetes bacterium]|nr:hypothetical protein [Planctomycetota bacterium]